MSERADTVSTVVCVVVIVMRDNTFPSHEVIPAVVTQ